MDKKTYTEFARRLFALDEDVYFELFQSVWNLCKIGVLDNTWVDHISRIDHMLYRNASTI